MKLACFSDTHAVPTRSPRRPSPSMSSPALTSPGTGLTKTEPAFCPPGWFSRRHLHDLGDLRLGGRAVAGARRATSPRRRRRGP